MGNRKWPSQWTKDLYQDSQWPAWKETIVDADGDPITSFEVKCLVRESEEKPVVKTFVPGSGLAVSSNSFLFDDVVDLVPGDYVVDVQVTISGDVYYIEKTKISVLSNVTR